MFAHLTEEYRAEALLAMDEAGGEARVSAQHLGRYEAGARLIATATLSALRLQRLVDARYRRGKPARYLLNDRGRARVAELRERGG